MIRLDQFSWQFAGASREALTDVSLHIRRGEFVAVAGPSGCGKTTLAMATCGLLVGRAAGHPSGSITVADHDVLATPLHQLSQTIGLVQQNPEANFATLRVCDEVAFGMENHCVPQGEMRRRVTESLDLLHISHLHDRELATLSGGEKQRVAVAAIVAGRPDVLILDEPTASLDPEASRSLFLALSRLCRETGLTVVVIEHKLGQLLPLRPRLVCLEAGRIVMDTPFGEPLPSRPIWMGRDDEPPAPAATQRLNIEQTAALKAEPPETEPVVDVTGLAIQLGGKSVLEDISFQIHPGETVAVMGPNGGGKTTLLQALLGVVELTAGTVRACGETIGPSGVSRLAKRVGFVFQNADHQLVGETVLGDAMYSAHHFKLPLEHRTQTAKRHLASAGLGDRLEDHPFALSWGEKRRLNLVSGVLHDPQLLLLDEPHAGQDWPNVRLMQSWVHDAVRQDERPPCPGTGACIVVTHDPRVVARWCTRVLFLANGRLVVDAPVAEAFERLCALGYGVYVPARAGEHRAEGDVSR